MIAKRIDPETVVYAECVPVFGIQDDWSWSQETSSFPDRKSYFVYEYGIDSVMYLCKK